MLLHCIPAWVHEPLPKPKKLNIQNLHKDVSLLMHRMKCKLEPTTNHNKPKPKTPLRQANKSATTQTDYQTMEYLIHSYIESD